MANIEDVGSHKAADISPFFYGISIGVVGDEIYFPANQFLPFICLVDLVL